MKKQKTKIKFRIPKSIYRQMQDDLRRPHEFAAERVGFLYTRSKKVKDTVIIIGSEYYPVKDEHYENDESVGASINSDAISESMQRIFDKRFGCFHVHLHAHSGPTSPSGTDSRSLPKVVESLSNINKSESHGYLILSNDSFFTHVKLPENKKLVQVNQVSIIGYPLLLHYPNMSLSKADEIYDRQVFLGSNSHAIFEKIRIGIVGYGGGGSHIGQQLAHLGFRKITIFDNDRLEATNLNRLVGGWFSDIKNKTLKTAIAKRVIKKIVPKANVEFVNDIWQNQADLLEQCDIVIGGVDSLIQRKELESECRRYLIPYIDIGMDIYKVGDEPHYISGQVILSMPGMACMKCTDFLNEVELNKEAMKYGATGGNPQVVWSNGVLASLAVGVVVDLISNWTKNKDKMVYLSYDGNLGTVTNHICLRFTKATCEHYPVKECGPIVFHMK